MTKKFTFLLFTLSAFLNPIFSQLKERVPDGGGNYQDIIPVKDDLSKQQRLAIISHLQQNETMLRSSKKLGKPSNVKATLFQWPIRQAAGYNDNGYYGISNYVDENPAFPNALLDYNCGNRTYDRTSGYNHAGTDIFIWPFSWQKMARNQVEIIAAAPGTIIDKSDGNFDQNCAFCTVACTWNAVYVMHADGSVAWYGHMKTGSLTTKAIGQTVTTGEYLGAVGSSGNSTGPHLHFEVYTNSTYNQLVDPWAGPCNNLNGLTSWWANQQPYNVSTLNKIMTHGAAPNIGNCVAEEMPNEKINFSNGEKVYLGSYYRDQLPGQLVVHTVYLPDNSIYITWNQTFNVNYSASWWYYTVNIPNAGVPGTWRYEVVYGSQKQTAYFAVNSSSVVICPGNYNVLTSNLTGSAYQWQVNTGNGFTNITNSALYAGVTTGQLQLKNTPSSYYGYQYRCVVNTNSFSNIIKVQFKNFWVGSANKAWEDPLNWSCGSVPDANMDVIIQNNSNLPEVSSNAACRSITVNPGTTITVKTGYRLTVSH